MSDSKETRDYLLQQIKDGYLDIHETTDPEEMDYLNKVLNKDTPKEPKESTSTGRFLCPTCKHHIHSGCRLMFFNNCPWCGQKLDWTKEREKLHERFGVKK